MLHWQVSRIGMIWLFLAVLVTVAPLVPHLPLWVMGIPLFGLCWRLGIYRGLLGAPGRIVRTLLVVVTVAGLGFTFKRLYGLEPMAAMLVCAFGLKLLEIRQRRDALVVIFLGYFLAATYALFDQSVVAGAVLLLTFTLITASLAGIHQSDSVRAYFRPLTTAALMLLQALPLMVIFFLVMPRLGSFWSVPSPNTAVTGMSDKLSIGDITQLGQSPEIAFRVTFDGAVPAKEKLYWRGLVFSGFDGKTWKPVSWGFNGGVVQWYGSTADWWREDLVLDGESFGYEIMIERQNGPWLYALQGSIPETKDTGVSRTQTLVAMVPVSKKFQYRVKSWPSVQFQPADLSAVRRHMELALPDGFNPQARAMAEQWAGETPDADDLINRALDYYRGSFYYTLQPPALGRDSIDDFLFTSRQGFCEHFAASFVFLMRAAGVPARLVVGYQGGEVHPEGGYLTVRQYDAHAWAEVWIAGEGWRQVDPTAAVAPDRISQGLISLLTAPVVLGQSMITLDRYQGINWINQVRLYLDSLEYAWGHWVLGYQNVQTGLLQRLLGTVDFKRLGLFVLVGSATALLPVLLYALWPRGRRRLNPLDKCYREFCDRMARHGCVRSTGEPPRKFAERCGQLLPERREAIEAITTAYERSRYGDGATDLKALRKSVRGI